MSEAVADLVQPKAEPEQVQPATATESQLDDSDQPDAAESKEEGTADHHPVGSKVVCDETSMLDEKLSVCVTRVPSQTPTLSESEGVSETVTLRHIYSIFCWLHCKDNNKMWRDDPLAACQKAVTDCRFMADADPEKLKAKLDEIRTIHAEIIEKYGGAEKVPQDLRVVPGGPLFNIVNFIFTGQCLKTKGADCVNFVSNNASGGIKDASGSTAVAESSSQRMPTSGPVLAPQQQQQQQQQRSVGGGPARHGRIHSHLSRDHPLVRKAMSLTADDVKQMIQELTIRKAMALRDARLLADWTAMKRRELEVKEMQLRNHIGGSSSVRGADRLEELIEFNDFLKKYTQ